MKFMWVLILLAASPAVSLASGKGAVRGSVQSRETQQLLQESTVVFIPLADTVRERRIVTQSGLFMILDMPPGTYRAHVMCEGYVPFMSPTFEVKADSASRLKFVLASAGGKADTAGTVRIGKPGVDYKMKYYRPQSRKYR